MKKIVCFLFTSCLLLSANAANAGPILSASGTFGGSNYDIYSYEAGDDRSWDTAKTFATSVGGYLATITSLDEDSYIYSLATALFPPEAWAEAWVGGSQTPGTTTATANWFWENAEGAIDGTNAGPNYANWLAGEPNDFGGPGAEQFLAINLLGEFVWNDEGNIPSIGGFVVESAVPEPSALILLTLGLVGLRLRRKQV